MSTITRKRPTTVQRFYDPVTDTNVAFDDDVAIEVQHDGIVHVTEFAAPVSIDRIAVMLYPNASAK